MGIVPLRLATPHLKGDDGLGPDAPERRPDDITRVRPKGDAPTDDLELERAQVPLVVVLPGDARVEGVALVDTVALVRGRLLRFARRQRSPRRSVASGRHPDGRGVTLPALDGERLVGVRDGLGFVPGLRIVTR
jgi:hypothetical protein